MVAKRQYHHDRRHHNRPPQVYLRLFLIDRKCLFRFHYFLIDHTPFDELKVEICDYLHQNHLNKPEYLRLSAIDSQSITKYQVWLLCLKLYFVLNYLQNQLQKEYQLHFRM